jgi:hypothetical protein
MARGPRKPRDHAADYARRIARAEERLGRPLARGERGAARGHVPPPGKTEARARFERETALGQLSTGQKATIRRFAEAKADFLGFDPEEVTEEAISWATAVGYDRALEEIRFDRRLGQQGRSMADLEFRSANEGGFPDPRWYYYRRADRMHGRSYTPRTEAQKAARRTRERRQRRRRASRRKAA